MRRAARKAASVAPVVAPAAKTQAAPKKAAPKKAAPKVKAKK
jgi:hypothetical protein